MARYFETLRRTVTYRRVVTELWWIAVGIIIWIGLMLWLPSKV